MSRLDAEYDPAEHHDLDRIVEQPSQPGDRWPWYAYCACGWSTRLGEESRGAARFQHDEHRDDELGIGCG